jgi:hypothetical protein
VSATVNIGGGGGGINCAFAGPTNVISVKWGVDGQTQTGPLGGFAPNGALVLKFTTPANGATLLRKGSVSGAEFGDPNNPRFGTLSTTACDFAGTNAPTITGTSPPQQQIFCFANSLACSTNVSFGFTFNPLKTGAALLQPNTTYYINLGNQSGSCWVNGSCNMIFNWSWVTS